MAMVPYRQGYGVLPVSTNSLFDIFDDMMDIPRAALSSKAFPVDVEDKGDAYEVKAYLTGVTKDDLDVELNEGRLSISVDKKETEEEKNKNYLHKESHEWKASRGIYLKDAATAGVHRLQRHPRCVPQGCRERGPFRHVLRRRAHGQRAQVR